MTEKKRILTFQLDCFKGYRNESIDLLDVVIDKEEAKRLKTCISEWDARINHLEKVLKELV